MPAFIRLGNSTSWVFTAALSIALLASGIPIISSADDKADSNTPVRIVVANPNGGQVVAPRQGYTIRWCAQGTDTVRIEYSPNGGRTWLLISDAVPAITEDNFHCPKPLLEQYLSSTVMNNMGSYTWNVPDIESGDVLIRVIDKLRPSISDVSDKPFAIVHGVSTGWTQQSVGSPVTLWSVSIVDDSVAWTCGREGVVFRTTNGGSSWIQGSSLPTHVTSVFALSMNTAFVCVNLTNDGRVYRTTDGGTSWTLVLQYTGSSVSIKNVHMFDANKGVALGDRDPIGGLWRIFKTSTGGATWDTLSQILEPGYGFRNAVAWISELKGWFGTDGSLVYSTTDGGLTWTSSDLGSLDVFCLVFPSEQLGMVSTAFRYIYKTTNGGSSWSYASTVPGTPLAIVAFIAGVTVPMPRWWATNMDEIYLSTNHGMTWTYETLANGYPFNDISMKYIQERGVIVGYAVAAADGVVMKYRETVTAVAEGPPHPLPSSVELRQNYPNPFNPTTNLEFRIPKSEFVTLRVYNILGQEVQTLVNERKGAGVHRVQFDAEGLPSGVYTYRIESGGQVTSLKMLLLK